MGTRLSCCRESVSSGGNNCLAIDATPFLRDRKRNAQRLRIPA